MISRVISSSLVWSTKTPTYAAASVVFDACLYIIVPDNRHYHGRFKVCQYFVRFVYVKKMDTISSIFQHSIHLLTWNVVTSDPPSSDKLKGLLEQNADFIGIGLQEVKAQPVNMVNDAIYEDPWTSSLRCNEAENC